MLVVEKGPELLLAFTRQVCGKYAFARRPSHPDDGQVANAISEAEGAKRAVGDRWELLKK